MANLKNDQYLLQGFVRPSFVNDLFANFLLLLHGIRDKLLQVVNTAVDF